MPEVAQASLSSLFARIYPLLAATKLFVFDGRRRVDEADGDIDDAFSKSYLDIDRQCLELESCGTPGQRLFDTYSKLSFPAIISQERQVFAWLVQGILPSVSRSAEQAVQNEATFRLANESLEQKACELGLSQERTPYLCECEDEGCTKIIQLTHREYEAVRAHPKRFVMVPGHEESDNLVVQEGDGFVVIEKRGEGELAAARDPRTASA